RRPRPCGCRCRRRRPPVASPANRPAPGRTTPASPPWAPGTTTPPRPNAGGPTGGRGRRGPLLRRGASSTRSTATAAPATAPRNRRPGAAGAGSRLVVPLLALAPLLGVMLVGQHDDMRQAADEPQENAGQHQPGTGTQDGVDHQPDDQGHYHLQPDLGQGEVVPQFPRVGRRTYRHGDHPFPGARGCGRQWFCYWGRISGLATRVLSERARESQHAREFFHEVGFNCCCAGMSKGRNDLRHWPGGARGAGQKKRASWEARWRPQSGKSRSAGAKIWLTVGGANLYHLRGEGNKNTDPPWHRLLSQPGRWHPDTRRDRDSNAAPVLARLNTHARQASPALGGLPFFVAEAQTDSATGFPALRLADRRAKAGAVSGC